MRLTLRTLLAWMDDTLPPAEVRQIGQQVAESPFAQELVDRIHRVTRQRRLTVPDSEGPEATDPNVVAAYLDNELTPEVLAEFEKRCLTSDVHLAEVASTHQILSLIGQKAKVPPEARNRMYRLIKGREAISVKVGRQGPPPAPEPVTEPLVPWAAPELPRRSWVEQFGPATFVSLLIVLLCWSAWMSLRPGDTQIALVAPPQQPPPQPPPGGDAPAAQAEAQPGNLAAPGAPGATQEADAPAQAEAPAAAKGDKPTPDLPADSLGATEASDGILLHQTPISWERLGPNFPLKEGDHLVSLNPLRNTIRLGPARIMLVGETEVRVHAPEGGLAALMDLVRGRLVIRDVDPPAPIGVNVAGQLLKITPPAGGVVGLDTGEPGSSPHAVKIYVPDKEVALASGEKKETLAGPGSIAFQAPDQFVGKEKRDAPAWVSDPNPSPLDKQIGEQFAGYFPPEQGASTSGVIKSLLEAMNDEQRDVRQMATSALGAIGEVDMVVPVLNTPGDAISRRAAIRALRSRLTLGEDAAKGVRDQLTQDLGAEKAAVVEKLLVGYSDKEAREEATYTKLVPLLNSPDLDIRELALDNLQTLTGRDDLGYNADAPEGEGLKSWQDLLRRKELRPLTPSTTK